MKPLKEKHKQYTTDFKLTAIRLAQHPNQGVSQLDIRSIVRERLMPIVTQNSAYLLSYRYV